MGLGFCTSEKVKFNAETGEKLSNGTWVSISFNLRSCDVPVLKSCTHAQGGICAYIVEYFLRHIFGLGIFFY